MRVHSIFLHLMRSLSECPLQGTRLVRQNADGIQRCATACAAWVQTGMANEECVLTA